MQTEPTGKEWELYGQIAQLTAAVAIKDEQLRASINNRLEVEQVRDSFIELADQRAKYILELQSKITDLEKTESRVDTTAEFMHLAKLAEAKISELERTIKVRDNRIAELEEKVTLLTHSIENSPLQRMYDVTNDELNKLKLVYQVRDKERQYYLDKLNETETLLEQMYSERDNVSLRYRQLLSELNNLTQSHMIANSVAVPDEEDEDEEFDDDGWEDENWDEE